MAQQIIIGQTPIDINGKVYYVSVDGNDSNLGDFDNPFRTFNKAHSMCTNSDAIILGKGSFTCSVSDTHIKQISIIGQGFNTTLVFDYSLRRIDSSNGVMYSLDSVKFYRLRFKTENVEGANLFNSCTSTKFYNVTFEGTSSAQYSYFLCNGVEFHNCIDVAGRSKFLRGNVSSILLNSCYGQFNPGYNTSYSSYTLTNSIINVEPELNEKYTLVDSSLGVGVYSGEFAWGNAVNLSGSIYIRAKHDSSIPCMIQPIYSDALDSTVRVYGQSSQELPIINRTEEFYTNSFINVQKPQKDILPSKIAVVVRNVVEGKVHVEGLKFSDIDAKIHTILRRISDLPSRFSIRATNYLIGNIGLYAADTSEISGHVISVQKPDEDLRSSIGIRYRNKVTGTSFIYGYDESGVYGSINVKRKSKLNCSINVAPDTIITGIVDIQPPERITQFLSVRKDAFIREGIPKLNYGSEQLLMAGYSSGKDEVFRSALGFDISHIANLQYGYKLERVLLKLRFSARREPDIPLGVYALNGDWDELGITWNNRPELGALLSDIYEIDFEENYIVFDVTQYVLEAKEAKKYDLNLYLKAVNESDDALRLYSKEAGQGYEPIIEYTYFDDIIRSTGRSNLDTTLNIVYRGNKDLSSSFNVKSYWNHVDLSSSIWAIQPGERESKLMVGRRFIFGSLIVREADDNDIQASIVIRETNLNDLENCFGYISRKFMHTALYVKHRYEVPSRLGVRVWDKSELFSWGIVSIKLRPGSIYVIPYHDWPGNIAIRRTEDCEIRSSIIISERVRPGSIDILHRDDLPGSLRTKQEEIVDTISSIIVNSKERSGSIYVIPYFDFSGKITVRLEDLIEVPGSILVSCPKLVGSIYTRFREDLETSLVIRRSLEKDIVSRIIPSFPDIVSVIYPRLHCDIGGSIVIRQSKEYDKDSKLYVLNRSDIATKMRIIGASKLLGSIRVISGWLGGSIAVLSQVIDNDISSSITIRQRLINDLYSKIKVIYVSWLPGSITSRQQLERGIEGSITVKRQENSDISGSLDVWITKDITSNLTVRITEDSYIYSNLEILDHEDILLALYIRPYESLPGKIDVRYRSITDMSSSIVSKIRDISDLSTVIDVSLGGRRDLKSKLCIAPENKMIGIVDIVQPIKKVTKIGLLKDAYIREDIPKLNYGGVQSLAVGRYNNSRLRSLLGFSIQDTPLDRIIDKVELKLYFPIGKEINSGLVLHEAPYQWQEYGVTWENQPKLGNSISNTFTVSEEGYIAFDITKFIDDRYQLKQDEISFYLAAEDEDSKDRNYFYSKESIYPPVIEVTHHSNVIWSSGRGNLDGSIDVKYRGSRGLASYINVYVDVGDSDVSGQLVVNTQGFRRGLITVNRPDMLSKVAVQRSSYTQIPCSMLIKIPGYDELLSSMMISQLNLKSNLYTLNRSNLISEITVRVEDNNDIFSWGYISGKERPALLFVAYHNQLLSKLEVNGKADNDIQSRLTVVFPKIPAKIVARQTKGTYILSGITICRKNEGSSISSILRVRQNKVRNLSSKVLVTRKSLLGYIRISKITDLDSRIKVQANAESIDILGSILVIKKALPGKIRVNRYFNLPSHIVVAPVEHNYTEINIGISRPDIAGYIEILESKDFTASIGVRVWTDDDSRFTLGVNRPDLPAKADIYYPSDIRGLCIVRVAQNADNKLRLAVGRPDMQSKVIVKYYEFLSSRVSIRHSSKSNAIMAMTVNRPDLLAKANIRLINDVVSSLTARQLSFIEINASLAILERQDFRGSIDVWHASKIPGVIRILSGNLRSLIGILGYEKSELTSTLGVQVPFKDDLPSVLKVITQWSLLESRLAIRVSNVLEGTADIIGYSETEIPASLILRISQDIPSTVGVTFKNKMSGIADFIPVGDSDIDCRICISPASDIKCFLTAIKYGDSEIEGSIRTKAYGRDIIGCKFNIVYRGNTDLSSRISITSDNKMVGKVFIIPVRDVDLDTYLMVHNISELTSKITVRREFRSEVEASVYALHHNNLHSSLYPIIHLNMPSIVAARRSSHIEIPCRLFTRLQRVSEIEGRIQPRYGFDIPSKIAVRRKAQSEIDSGIYALYRSNLESKIYPIVHYNTQCSIAVRQRDESELLSSIHPIIHSDISSKIISRQRDKSDIFGRIIIRQRADYDIPSRVWPRLSVDIPGFIITRQIDYNDIDGIVVARQRDDSDLLSIISVRKRAEYDMNSAIWPRYNKEIQADMFVLYHDDIISSIEAITAYPYAYIM